MEPYQKASEQQRASGEYPLKTLEGLGKSAIWGVGAKLGAQAGGKLITGIGAFLSDYIPDNISKAGLEKLDPRLGKFIQGAMDEGYSYDDLRQFMGDKMKKSQSEPDKKNIIEQYSPELHLFIDQQVKKGRPSVEAGALAQQNDKFRKVIKKLEKDHKTNWSSIVESVYGQGQPTEETQQPSNSKNSGAENISGAFKDMAGGISDNFYIQSFDALKKGKTRMAGIEDPLLKKAKPFFDKGLIHSPEDLRAFAQKYFEQKQQPRQGSARDELMNTLKALNQKFGS